MTMYGIKTCSSVGKAIKFMKDKDIAFDFVDYKKEKVDEAKIREWLTKVDLALLFNAKGTKYRDLKLKELNLDDEGKIAWMTKENYLIKRPVIEYGEGKVLVGYNEEQYTDIFKGSVVTTIEKVDVEVKQISGLKIRTCNADEMNPETQKIGALWGQLMGAYAPPFPHYGVYHHYESDLNGSYDLLAGVEGDCDGCSDTVKIQAGRYLKFSAKGELHVAVMECWKHIWAYFEDPSVDERRAYETDFEVYSSMDEVAVYIGVHYL